MCLGTAHLWSVVMILAIGMLTLDGSSAQRGHWKSGLSKGVLQ